MRSEVAVSERRACGLIQIHRGTYRYRRRPEDGRLRVRLRELAEERRRFGYRRLQALLVREGWVVNHKRVYRLYVEEKLGIRRKRGRRRAPAGARLVLAPATEPEQVWTMDFTQDAFASGRRFRTLNLMDGCTREALEIEVDTSLPGLRVVRVLEGRWWTGGRMRTGCSCTSSRRAGRWRMATSKASTASSGMSV